MNSQNIQDEIRDSIFSMFDVDQLPEDQQEEVVHRVGAIIFESALLRILPMLDETNLKEYEELLKKEDIAPDEIVQFFFDKVPGFLDIIAEESERLRNDATEVVSKIKK